MRTQLRRQAAAHTDHVQDVLKVQEHELKAEAEQVIYPRVCLHIRNEYLPDISGSELPGLERLSNQSKHKIYTE